MTDRPSAWTRPPEVEAILAVGSLILFAGVTGVVVFHRIPTDNEKYAMLMLGALIGVVKDTFGRYFQATKGAAEQRVETAKVAATLAAGAAASLANSNTSEPLNDLNVTAETVNVEPKP